MKTLIPLHAWQHLKDLSPALILATVANPVVACRVQGRGGQVGVGEQKGQCSWPPIVSSEELKAGAGELHMR